MKNPRKLYNLWINMIHAMFGVTSVQLRFCKSKVPSVPLNSVENVRHEWKINESSSLLGLPQWLLRRLAFSLLSSVALFEQHVPVTGLKPEIRLHRGRRSGVKARLSSPHTTHRCPGALNTHLCVCLRQSSKSL